MNTIALRFSDNYAPPKGTIALHEEIINEKGYVWFGKFGNNISKEIIKEQMNTKDPKFLLIKSGGLERYWVHFTDFKTSNEIDFSCVPEYYRDNIGKIKCWFKIIEFEKAEKDILSKCFVLSTGQCLSLASKYSMNPYFKIKYDEKIKEVV